MNKVSSSVANIRSSYPVSHALGIATESNYAKPNDEIPIDLTLVDEVSPVKILSTNIENVSESQHSLLAKTSIELSKKRALESDEYNSMIVKSPNKMQNYEGFDACLSDSFKEEYNRRQKQAINILQAGMTNDTSHLINFEKKSKPVEKENSCPNIRPSKCFDPKMQKPRKTEALEHSFLQLSKAIQEKMSNPIPATQSVQVPVSQGLAQSTAAAIKPATQAFSEFVATMLSQMPKDLQDQKMKLISDILFQNN